MIKLKADMRLKYMGSKAWLARLLGDVTVLHSPFFGSGKLEHYLPPGARAWRRAASTPSSPSQTCTAAT